MSHSAFDSVVLTAQLNPQRPLPPVDHWTPPLLGDMDLRITRDGVWHHAGTPIQREPLIHLFASILRQDEDGCYYLVTPAEKWRIQVDDAPFLAIQLDVSGTGPSQNLTFTTNVGDIVTAGLDHPLIVEYPVPGGEPSPHIHIRSRLHALLSRAVFVELAELGEERQIANDRFYGVWSQGQFFNLGQLDDRAI
ncbi:MAG: DUF1285 domain-containing protein [Gammaproteobacteria bacterium]|nr:DUF1285 domain-containing protein [Gammaproteobacteria bacterium]MCP5197766.1 DUF1285 domain-containing protein [Gammaproteobacteria bacterium]